MKSYLPCMNNGKFLQNKEATGPPSLYLSFIFLELVEGFSNSFDKIKAV